MFEQHENVTAVTAADARRHLVELFAERALAIENGVGEVDVYMADLDHEIETWRQLYVISAVTEIAVLRGGLGGRHAG